MIFTLIFFYKIVNGATPRYLTSYLNTNENPVYNKRVSDQNKIRRFRARIEHFKQLFFPFCVNEWYKLDWETGTNLLREAKSIKHLKFKEFFNLKQSSIFAIHDPVGVKGYDQNSVIYMNLNFIIISKMFPATCVIAAHKLKQQTTSSCVAHFLQKIEKNS